MKMRVWVTGSGGLLGSHVVRQVPAGNVEVVAMPRSVVDLRNHEEVRELFNQAPPDGVIHCAAISNTGICETHPELADEVNVGTTRLLTELATDIPLVFLSTDIVFDGLKGGYKEDDVCAPINVYGMTKREAEGLVLKNPMHSVLRLSLNGGISPTGDRGFNEVLRRSFAGGNEVKLFTDEYRQPIPATVTADIIWEVYLNGWTGIYHLGGAERMSRYEIGMLLAQRWPSLSPKVIPASLKEFTGGRRAPDTSMDCHRLQSLLPFRIPGLREWLEGCPDSAF
ncbi:MAG: SDR family oxidoreductase [Verrucomicrobia bacterium]|jgi:dTDP-4-dehydrorhamnose reductase|nr:SDR family oxidoreductase [Verrucomicrobiota bacterium]MDB4746477.1 SDR family oxidoreductase [Verrucomicrobiota bacterium]